MTSTDHVQQILAVYRELGHRRYGESVTELEHALQTAAFARQFGEPDTVVAAALLHDFGHLQHHSGEDIAERGVDMVHENLGAAMLKDVFAPEVVEPIRLHVAAKRYLCWKSPSYLDGLSPVSRRSLQLQGGPMTLPKPRRSSAIPTTRRQSGCGAMTTWARCPTWKRRVSTISRSLLESLVTARPR